MIRDRISSILRYVMLLLPLLLLRQATGNVWITGLLLLTVLLVPMSWGANLYIKNKIQIKLLLPTSSAKNQKTIGTIELKNNSILPVVKTYCRLNLVNDLTGEEEYMDFILGVGAKQSVTREFQVESKHCGRIYFSVMSAKLMDYFGLVSVKVPIKASKRLTVIPDLFSCDVSASPTPSDVDESVGTVRGDDRTELFQLREYQSGDDVRQIHWKLSSKLDNMIFREPGQSISRSLLVVWDKRTICSPDMTDTMAEVVASVCHSLCENGVAFDLCWTEKNDAELRQIRNIDELIQAIPALVTQSGARECVLPDFELYGKVLYVSCDIPKEKTNQNTMFLLCTETDCEALDVITFSTHNYREKLERLEL